MPRLGTMALPQYAGRSELSTWQMAIRLDALLGTSAETWVAMQADDDLWQAKQKRHPKIARVEVAA